MALDRRLPGPEAEPCVGGMRKACAWKSPRDLARRTWLADLARRAKGGCGSEQEEWSGMWVGRASTTVRRQGGMRAFIEVAHVP